MPEQKEGKYASALDAIEAVAEEASVREAAEREAAEKEAAAQEAALNEAVAQAAIKRGQAERRLLLWVVLPIVVISLGFGIAYLWNDRENLKKQIADLTKIEEPSQLEDLAKWPVAVLLPLTDQGPVVDNAVRQWEGFKFAFEKNQVYDRADSKHRHFAHFNYPLNLPDDRDAIINQIKEWYGQGIRTFIITMSGAVTEIKGEFSEWAKTKPENDRPVLVATVASAPEIADRENGVFRYYIRSRDESPLLAAHAESLQATEVYVFYVKDTYGIEAKNILEKRLQKTAHFRDYEVPVKFNEAAQNAIKLEIQTILRETTSGENAMVMIVGYGGMINFSIETLRDEVTADGERYKGKVLVVSTFTEDEWRPKNLNGDHDGSDGIKPLDERLYTVGPVHVDGSDENPGVVYQFSFLTLDRALHCKDNRGIEAFWSCWSSVNTPQQGHLEVVGVEAEFTANGDSHVSLRLLNKDQW